MCKHIGCPCPPGAGGTPDPESHGGTLWDNVCPWGSALSRPHADESSLKMNHVEHIPQSPASHGGSRLWDTHGADMLRPDPRDTFFLSKGLGPCPCAARAEIWEGRRQDLAVTGTPSIPPAFYPALGWQTPLLGTAGDRLGRFGHKG